MKIGYCRVSTDDQNPDLQLAALKRAGCRTIFTDKASGAHVARPELAKCLKAHGVAFRSLTETIDTATATGRAMWQMVDILAELERSLIQERTKAGRAAAVARGVKMGRKPKLTPQQVAHARKLLERGEDRRDIARLLKVSWRTVERTLRNSCCNK